MNQRKLGSVAASPRQGPLAPRDAGPARSLPAPPTADRMAVAAALLAHGATLAASAGGGAVRFTPDEAANALVYSDPFAFLIAVICDQGIVAERAWLLRMSCGGASATSTLTAWPPRGRRSWLPSRCHRACTVSLTRSPGGS
jgi:hypothetical protein